MDSVDIRRPVIGIATALEIASYGVWIGGPCALLQFSYIESIQHAGGLALMLPPDLAGGCDVDPARYGQEQHPETVGLVPARDDFEFALLERAIERDMPTLCVCRGMQVLNVVRGGTLIQHLPDVLRHDEHRRNLGTFEGNDHDVQLVAGSLAAQAAGGEVTLTKSHHHQGIDELGEGLVVTGRSTEDDLAEAIELPESSFVLGVQWHPEADTGSRVMHALVAEARQRISVAS